MMLFISFETHATDHRAQLIPIQVNGLDSMQIYFEVNSIAKIGSVIRYRLHTLFTPSINENYDENGITHEFEEPVSKLIDTVEMSCNYKTFTTVKREFFGVDNNLLWELDNENGDEQEIAEGQISEFIYSKLCTKRSKTEQST